MRDAFPGIVDFLNGNRTSAHLIQRVLETAVPCSLTVFRLNGRNSNPCKRTTIANIEFSGQVFRPPGRKNTRRKKFVRSNKSPSIPNLTRPPAPGSGKYDSWPTHDDTTRATSDQTLCVWSAYAKYESRRSNTTNPREYLKREFKTAVQLQKRVTRMVGEKSSERSTFKTVATRRKYLCAAQRAFVFFNDKIFRISTCRV